MGCDFQGPKGARRCKSQISWSKHDEQHDLSGHVSMPTNITDRTRGKGAVLLVESYANRDSTPCSSALSQETCILVIIHEATHGFAAKGESIVAGKSHASMPSLCCDSFSSAGQEGGRGLYIEKGQRFGPYWPLWLSKITVAEKLGYAQRHGLKPVEHRRLRMLVAGWTRLKERANSINGISSECACAFASSRLVIV
jgi:hypothetical protein